MESEDCNKSLNELIKHLNPVIGKNQLSNPSGEEVKINLAGTTFITKRETLQAIPGSLLCSLSTDSPYYKSDAQEYFFDRDADLFKHVLNAHRDGELHMPRDVCPRKFKQEVEFWGIPKGMLSPCCWHTFYGAEDELQTLNTLVQNTSVKRSCVIDSDSKTTFDRESDQENTGSLRQRIWLLLDDASSSTAARMWCFIYIFVVFASTVIYMISTDEVSRVDHYITSNDAINLNDTGFIQKYRTNPKILLILTTDPHPAILAADGFCTFFFLIESIVHFCVSPNKKLYFTRFNNCFKSFLAVVMVISFIMDFRKEMITTETQGYAIHILSSINVLRLLLLFRMRKHYKRLDLMLLSLEQSCRELSLLLLVFTICIIVYGGMIFSAEFTSNMFENTRVAMWWALITMTTVGYGDYYPTQTLGYFIGLMCAINGLIVIALPVAAIAQNFSNYFSGSADIEKHLMAVQNDKNKHVQSSGSTSNVKEPQVMGFASSIEKLNPDK